MTNSNNCKFSTKDKDNTGNSENRLNASPWWYCNSLLITRFTGRYGSNGIDLKGSSNTQKAKEIIMMIRHNWMFHCWSKTQGIVAVDGYITIFPVLLHFVNRLPFVTKYIPTWLWYDLADGTSTASLDNFVSSLPVFTYQTIDWYIVLNMAALAFIVFSAENSFSTFDLKQANSWKCNV